ncbi:MAG: ribose 5-phosphate isomerase B [Alphaproteobacteria bacterium]|nr:ribose 5-phosphate isomerase B [Alphaproteobacteria bacterium]
MQAEPIVIASDHAGVDLKSALVAELERLGLAALDLGTGPAQPADYPDVADRVAAAIAAGRARRGVLICGTGIGVSIAANRHRNIRAALCHDVSSSRLCREHNDANVLVLGARMIGTEVAKDCLATFLSTPFAGGRHAPRVAKLA